MQITAQSAFYQCGSANDAAAAQISFSHEMHVAACSNCPAETAADLVIAQINMGAASGTNRRSSRTANLLFSLAFKTLDYQAALPLPEIRKSVTDREIVWGR